MLRKFIATEVMRRRVVACLVQLLSRILELKNYKILATSFTENVIFKFLPKYKTAGMKPQWKAVLTTSKTIPSRSFDCSDNAIVAINSKLMSICSGKFGRSRVEFSSTLNLPSFSQCEISQSPSKK